MLCYRCGSHVLDGSPVCETCGQKFTVRTRHPSRARPRQSDSSPISGAYQPGERIADRYEVKGVAGQGPIGIVYRAIDREVDVEVAVKVITPKLLQSEEERQTLRSEARLIRALSHKGCPKVYEDGFDGDQPYLVMQYLEGLSLRRIIDLRHGKGQPFKVEELKPIFQQLFGVLGYAHRFKHGDRIGFAHGHVKPQNVVVLPDVLKLVDFREACFIPRVPYVAAQRVRGGEAEYIAPEVVEGREVTPLADMYGLGMLLWEMLSGHEDLASDNMDLSLIEGVPRTMDMVFRRLVAERPVDRYQKIAEVADDFEAALDGRVPPHASVRKPLTAVPRKAQPEIPEYLASGEFDLLDAKESLSDEPGSFDDDFDLEGDIQLGEDEIEEIVDADKLGFSLQKKKGPSSEVESEKQEADEDQEQSVSSRPTLEVLDDSDEERRYEERTRRERRPGSARSKEMGSASSAPKTDGRVARPIGVESRPIEAMETRSLETGLASESATDPEVQVPPELREQAALSLDEASEEEQAEDHPEAESAPEVEKEADARLAESAPKVEKEADASLAESAPEVEKERDAPLAESAPEVEKETDAPAAESAPEAEKGETEQEGDSFAKDAAVRLETEQFDRDELLAAAAEATRVERERLQREPTRVAKGPKIDPPRRTKAPSRPAAKGRDPVRFVIALAAMAFSGLVLALVISEDMRSTLGFSGGREALVDTGDEFLSNGDPSATRPIGGTDASNGDQEIHAVEPAMEEHETTKEDEPASEHVDSPAEETEDASLVEKAKEPEEPEPASTKARRQVEKQPTRKAPARTRPADQQARVKKAETRRPPDAEPTERTQKVAARTPRPAAADARGHCPAGMVFVPSGTFRMGSSLDDPMRNLGEKALTDLNVEAFCIDRYEYGGTGREPQTGVTWYQAKELCEARGRRLCSEEEWERACKGPRNLRFPYGNSFDPDACNTKDEDGNPRQVAEAGAFQRCRSGFGVLDMSGNVAEWTASRFQEGRQDRTIKGGSANRPDWDTRCAARGNRPPSARDRHLGFRCCGDPL